MADTGIVRNRAKIEATIANARAAADLDVDLGELLWSFAPAPRPPVRPTCPKVPAVTPESTAMAKELKRRGFRFVGPTTAYALDAGHRNGRRPHRGLLGSSAAVTRWASQAAMPGSLHTRTADREQ